MAHFFSPEILGEGNGYLVVLKPAGILVHPTKPGGPRTLLDALRELLSYEIASGGQISLVNRLDRETSGLVLVATTSDAARRLGLSMQHGRIAKKYLALVRGWPDWETSRVEAPLLREGSVRTSAVWLKQCVHPDGAPATTELRVLRKFRKSTPAGERFSLIEARPLTGRTHQIRVHLAQVGHPVVGDKLYGPSHDLYLRFIETGWTPELAEQLLLPRHALHASGLEIIEPGLEGSFQCGLPEDLSSWLPTG